MHILIVDDHNIVREGIKGMLLKQPTIVTVDEVGSGEDALKFCKKSKPDIVLMDQNMDGINGIETTKRLKQYHPNIKIIVLTQHSDVLFANQFIQAGAKGFLTKGGSIDEIMMAIKKVISGSMYINPDVAQEMALSKFNGMDENPFEKLSPKELQLAQLILKGHKKQHIADMLCVSPKTIYTYKTRLFEKLQIETDVQLAHTALNHNFS